MSDEVEAYYARQNRTDTEKARMAPWVAEGWPLSALYAIGQGSRWRVWSQPDRSRDAFQRAMQPFLTFWELGR